MEFKNVAFGPTQTIKTHNSDGSILFRLNSELKPFPETITDRLREWSIQQPEKTFIAQRNKEGIWQELSYADIYQQMCSIAQNLLDMGFEENDTIVILSENSLEHALLALASVHIGIAYSPISPAYSLVSEDFSKLRHCLEKMTPKLVFVQSEQAYTRAIQFIKNTFPEVTILVSQGDNFTNIASWRQSVFCDDVAQAHKKVKGDTVAKILFTSGSTGLPKGVINTQQMWCANLQQITQSFPFMQEQAPVFIDWLPWNHTFGGNHNFGLALHNGGTLYIDDGKPSSKGIEETVKNLREISPTAYFNVPKGFEMLIPYLEKEEQLRNTFFKNLQIIFYAGASLAQPIWNKLEELAIQTIGVKIPIVTGLGCTESGPSALFANWGGAFSGLLGVPVAGLEVKLVPLGDKWEARYRAANVTKGYWRNPEATLQAFDEEGFYKTGDAVKFLDENNPDKGLVFDGRIAEDFKLSTGTWVNVGVMKTKIISSGSPIIQDVVIAGLDQDYIGLILFLNIEACCKLTGHTTQVCVSELYEHSSVKTFINTWMNDFNAHATGSSTSIGKVIIAHEPPSIDKGEITDKGSLNQRAVLSNRKALVSQLFSHYE
ncbi:feruloyl-CoA synthase [Flectobacillus sp. DC10W]|uniref:Feruloyl-CoA synthase n=1 Tax=Flectobacillus longus TaxID=2984207 RepID=A0ABT6YTW7_9BACT|nr:feruloyl-CoA synthase [Flectobacillus longus]MDI9866980.1 feruloyl-CoA synthase [Flectobacillus longus]